MTLLTRSRHLAGLVICASIVALAGCTPASAPQAAPTSEPIATSTPEPTATPTQTSVLLPMTNTGSADARVLFLAGDFLPESGYPHSRVRDDGSRPESFSQLRTQVLEGELGLKVEEFIVTADATISPDLLTPYRFVVLGSNGRVLRTEEVAALTQYLSDGGAMLIYADFQYGPDNWKSDNAFLNQFGIEVFPDNFQPTTQITEIVPSHPIMNGVRSFATEGSSQFLISAAARGATTILSRCSPLERLGCALQEPERARVGPDDDVVCTWVRAVGNGRMAGTCDRNTFHNGPGIGTALSEFDNKRYAVNLFRWLADR